MAIKEETTEINYQAVFRDSQSFTNLRQKCVFNNLNNIKMYTLLFIIIIIREEKKNHQNADFNIVIIMH